MGEKNIRRCEQATVIQLIILLYSAEKKAEQKVSKRRQKQRDRKERKKKINRNIAAYRTHQVGDENRCNQNTFCWAHQEHQRFLYGESANRKNSSQNDKISNSNKTDWKIPYKERSEAHEIVNQMDFCTRKTFFWFGLKLSSKRTQTTSTEDAYSLSRSNDRVELIRT